MRTILRDNYTPSIGDYHECLVVDEPEKKIWLFDCDGVYSDISPVTVVSELGDSEKYAASQKLVTGLNSDLWTEVGVINDKIAALATDFSYKGSVEDYAHLPDDAAVGDVYTTLDTGIIYVWDGNQWVALNEVPENEVVSVYTDTAIVSGTPLTLYSDEECTDAVTIGSIVRNIEAGKSYQIIRIGDAVDEAYLIYPVISARDDGFLEDGRFGVHIYDGRSLFYLRADLASATELTVSGKLIPSDILDEPGSSYTAVMSQAGVTNLINRNAGAPTSTTEGTVGSLIEDTTNGKLYICTNVDETDPSNPVYTWEEVGSGVTIAYIKLADFTADYFHLYKDVSLTDYYTYDEVVSVYTNGTLIFRIVDAVNYSTPADLDQYAQDSLVVGKFWDSDPYSFCFETFYDSPLSGVTHTKMTKFDIFCANRESGESDENTYFGYFVNLIEKDLPIVRQTTGTSTTDIMSQNATTSMVFADPSTKNKVRIGNSASFGTNMVAIGNVNTLWQSTQPYSSVFIGDGAGVNNGYGAQGQVAIGYSAKTSQGVGCVSIGHSTAAETDGAVALGYSAKAKYQYSVAFSGATASAKGEMAVGAGGTHGYNNTAYRLITGVHDPVSANDAATKGYVDTAVAGAGAATINSTDWSNLWQ